MVKKSLFEEEDQPIEKFSSTRMKINKPFAEKFEKRVQRQLIDQAKVRYGPDYEKKMEMERTGRGSDDESSDMQEDSDGDLINDTVADKFISTLARIRSKDPSIYKASKTFFKDKDFEDVVGTKKAGAAEKMTYADMIRKDAMRKMEQEGDANSDDNDDDGDEYGDASSSDRFKKSKTYGGAGETIADEQRRIKEEFKKAALEFNGRADGSTGGNGGVEDEEEDVDAIFTQKKKSAQQLENENKEYEKFMVRVAAKKNKKDKKKAKAGKSSEQDLEALQDFWGDANKLDDTDKFLRKYIMTKGWVDRDDMGEMNEELEEQDEKRDDEADRFEAKFNFRYEESDANQVTTYGRKVDGSLRQKDSKRADLRKERDERKKDSKRKLEEEIKQIKSATKGALMDRIQKIQQISGTSSLKANINALLDDDFDDEKFTKQLEKQVI